jgi:CTP:molybdopterin cytidylyltransferase MocA
MIGAGFNQVFLVTGAVDLGEIAAAVADETGVVIDVVDNPEWRTGQASSLQAAIARLRGTEHSAAVFGLGDQPDVGVAPWRVVGASVGPIVAASFDGKRRPPVKLDRSVWDLLPSEGDDGARVLMREHPELVSEVPCLGNPADIDTVDDLIGASGTAARPSSDPDDVRMVTELIGREPMGEFAVCVRRFDRSPVVVSNRPLFPDGRPMPTRFWLCDPDLVRAISQLESDGGVKKAEADVDPEGIAATHDLAAAERDALIPGGHAGPRPFGGVGGTRQGVKCLHTHFANYLAGAPDVVGEWVVGALESAGFRWDPAEPGIGSS